MSLSSAGLAACCSCSPVVLMFPASGNGTRLSSHCRVTHVHHLGRCGLLVPLSIRSGDLWCFPVRFRISVTFVLGHTQSLLRHTHTHVVSVTPDALPVCPRCVPADHTFFPVRAFSFICVRSQCVHILLCCRDGVASVFFCYFAHSCMNAHCTASAGA